jgi:L-ascorbate metabolism protein UlaG (beta-lactamase superfamily)
VIQPVQADDVLLADIQAAAAQADQLHVWWLGQSGFLLRWRDKHLLLDPYLSDSLTRKYAATDRPHVRMTKRVIDPKRLGFVDVITSSHHHTDHLDAETLLPIRRANPRVQIVVPAASHEFAAERLNMAATGLLALDAGQSLETAGFTFHAVPAAHETIERDESGRCRFLGYVVQCGPFVVYHSGDTVLYDGMTDRLRQWTIDLALLPINGRAAERRVAGNLWGREAAQLANAIAARQVIPCHYEMFAFNTASPDEFVETCQQLGQPHTVLRCGERWSSAVARLVCGAFLAIALCAAGGLRAAEPPRGYSIPLIDLASETKRQVVVDRDPQQYLGHPTTVLLEDQRTILVVYPEGHGKGAIVLKRSRDGGLSWSERLPVPSNWATSRETPTIHRVVDAHGTRRLIVWSGLYPARLAVSEDDGATWSPLRPVGDWGGIVVMSSVVPLGSPGHYLALFHDDGRYLREGGQAGAFTLLQTRSSDGGLTWSQPVAILTRDDVHLCEPGAIRSPDGKQLAVLLRENSRRRNSFVIFSADDGQTWTEPRELPGSLTGDRHVGKYAPDGRLWISFRDTTHESPTQGDWVAWVGTYDDIVSGREGQYRVRLMDNHSARDCAYPGVEVLPDGTIVTTTYGHWTAGQPPYIVCVRLKLSELDELAAAAGR